jgi:hypothetical protein
MGSTDYYNKYLVHYVGLGYNGVVMGGGSELPEGWQESRADTATSTDMRTIEMTLAVA